VAISRRSLIRAAFGGAGAVVLGAKVAPTASAARGGPGAVTWVDAARIREKLDDGSLYEFLKVPAPIEIEGWASTEQIGSDGIIVDQDWAELSIAQWIASGGYMTEASDGPNSPAYRIGTATGILGREWNPQNGRRTGIHATITDPWAIEQVRSRKLDALALCFDSIDWEPQKPEAGTPWIVRGGRVYNVFLTAQPADPGALITEWHLAGDWPEAVLVDHLEFYGAAKGGFSTGLVPYDLVPPTTRPRL
jgi:hypothetical protein